MNFLGVFKIESLCLLALSSFLLCTQAQLSKSWCANQLPSKQGSPLPPLFPPSYSVRIQINYESHHYSTEIVEKENAKSNTSSVEIWSGNRHVRYIAQVKENAYLTIIYNPTGPTCTVSSDKQKVFQKDDSGPSNILQILTDKILPQKSKFRSKGPDTVKGVYAFQWMFCDYISELGTAAMVSLYFSDSSWTSAYPVPKESDQLAYQLVMMEIQVQNGISDDIRLTADVLNFDLSPPDDMDFQPPEGVHCPNYRSSALPPPIPPYFSYKSELVSKGGPNGTSSVISHIMIYYDSRLELIRYDLQASVPKRNSVDLVPRVYSIIHDYKLGVYYTMDTGTGSCNSDSLDDIFESLNLPKTESPNMPTPSEFFTLNDAKTSYNGKYKVRGLTTDMYSALIRNAKGIDMSFFWYFTTDDVQAVEGAHVEKNILVKMIIHPETVPKDVGEIEINFYNFIKEEPSEYTYDITLCFNDSDTRTFVLTFPGDYNSLLMESKNTVREKMHQKLQEVAGVNQQRIAIQSVSFREKYLFVQFKILDLPSVVKTGTKPVKESDLETAIKKLKKSIAGKDFLVTIWTEDNVEVALKPEPSGLNEYSGDYKNEAPKSESYSEGSVIGLAVGMMVIGTLLGGVLVNLIINRKYGVSLFLKNLPGDGARNFNNLGESSM